MIIGITGSRGFIGSALVQRLKVLNYDIREFTGDLLTQENLDVFTKDCDQIVHLAGVFSNDFSLLMDINVRATYNLSESAKKHGVRRVVFASTGAVYGEPLTGGKKSSENDLTKPSTLYGLSKSFAEDTIQLSRLPYIFLRFSNVYGPANKKGVIYNFLHDIYKKKRVILYGSGRQSRNFLYITDAVEALVAAIESEYQNEIFNIADGKSYTLQDVLHILQKKILLEFKIEEAPADPANLLQNLSEDIQKAAIKLKWIPRTNLEEGLRITLKTSGYGN